MFVHDALNWFDFTDWLERLEFSSSDKFIDTEWILNKQNVQNIFFADEWD